jgi:heme-degrading monooxygenase HmoA
MTTTAFANTPEPPYYAVIFSSLRTPIDSGYAEMADQMVALAAKQPGYLGIESARDADGFGITVSYWQSLAAIRAWRLQIDHQAAQSKGKSDWYQRYQVRIALVERDYGTTLDSHC